MRSLSRWAGGARPSGDRHHSFTHNPDASRRRRDLIVQMTTPTKTHRHRHVDLQVGALERKRRRARARSANVVRRAMRARRSIIG
jgi:hypothetical protein